MKIANVINLLLHSVGCFLLSMYMSSCQQDFVDGKTYLSIIVNHLDDENYVHALKIKNEYSFLLDYQIIRHSLNSRNSLQVYPQH